MLLENKSVILSRDDLSLEIDSIKCKEKIDQTPYGSKVETKMLINRENESDD